MQLLWVNMIMDTLGALALATEPPNDDLMKRPPIGRNADFITKAMWRNILGQSVYQFTVLCILSFDGERLLRLTGPNSQAILNTVIFNSFVFCQVAFCSFPCLKVLICVFFSLDLCLKSKSKGIQYCNFCGFKFIFVTTFPN